MSDGFLLDTNVLSEFNRTGKPNENVRQWPPWATSVEIVWRTLGKWPGQSVAMWRRVRWPSGRVLARVGSAVRS